MNVKMTTKFVLPNGRTITITKETREAGAAALAASQKRAERELNADERREALATAGGGMFATTSLYWDCECETDFIHRSSADECAECGAVRSEQPDARVNEIVGLGLATVGYFEERPEAVEFHRS